MYPTPAFNDFAISLINYLTDSSNSDKGISSNIEEMGREIAQFRIAQFRIYRLYEHFYQFVPMLMGHKPS